MGIVIRQSIKGTVVTYIGAFIGFLTTLFIVPRFLGEELYGLTRVLLEAGLLFAAIFQLGASSSAIRFFPHFHSEDDKKHNGFFSYLIGLVTVGFLLFIPLFLLLRQPISDYFETQSALFSQYLYWIIPLTFFLLYWVTFETYSNVLMRIAVPKFIREILVRLLIIGVYMAYALGYVGLIGFITGFVCVYGIAMLVTFVYISRIGSISLARPSNFITPALRKEFLSYSSIILLGSLGGSIVGKIDVFMITGEIGLASTGIYAVAFYMISIVDIPSRSITAISAPLASQALQRGDIKAADELYKSVSLHQLLIGSMIFLMIWINIDNIYAIIPNGEVYSAGKWVILFVGTAKLIEITLSFGTLLISYSKHYKWNLYFVFFISGITILSNYILIPKWGISGAAVATTISCLISYGLQQTLIYFKIKTNPYSIGTLKTIGLLLALFALNHLLPNLESPWLDGLYRTFIIGLLACLSIYFLRISEVVNRLVDKWRK